MAEGRSAQYHFAILAFATIDLKALASAVAELRTDYPHQGLLKTELYGRVSSGELIVLFQFSFLSYSSALRTRMEREARRLSGKVLDPQLLPAEERERFYDRRLKDFETRVELGADPADALEQFKRRMHEPVVAQSTAAPEARGSAAEASARSKAVRVIVPSAPVETRPPFVATLSYPDDDALAQALRECIAQGVLKVPPSARLETGSALQVELKSAQGSVVMLPARVVGPDFDGNALRVVPDASDGAAKDFLKRHGQPSREGRKLVAPPSGERRGSDRFHTSLEVAFQDLPSLSAEFATNISQGGLFVQTQTPPPLRARVRLSLTLPDGEQISTDAEVVHVVTPEDAARVGRTAGVGLSFVTSDDAFQGRIETLLASYRERKPLVLVVDDNAFFRHILADALAAAGMETVVAANGEQAFGVLVDRLYELDAMTMDLEMPGLDGFGLIDRIRRIGGEQDLRVLVVSGRVNERLTALVESGQVNGAIQKSSPLPEIVNAVREMVRQR